MSSHTPDSTLALFWVDDDDDDKKMNNNCVRVANNEISEIPDTRATAMLSMHYIDAPAGFWHLLNACMLSLLCWVFPWVTYKKCMRVLGSPQLLSVYCPGPPPAPCRRETGAWMRVFVSHCWPPRLMWWLHYSSKRLTRCLHNLRFSSFPWLASCHQLPRGNPGHGKRAAGSSCHISVHSCKH